MELLEEVAVKVVAMLHVVGIVVWVDLSGGAPAAEGLEEAEVVGQAVVVEALVDLEGEVLGEEVLAVNGKNFNSDNKRRLIIQSPFYLANIF